MWWPFGRGWLGWLIERAQELLAQKAVTKLEPMVSTINSSMKSKLADKAPSFAMDSLKESLASMSEVHLIAKKAAPFVCAVGFVKV